MTHTDAAQLTDLIESTERQVARHENGPVGDFEAYRAGSIKLRRRLTALENAAAGTVTSADREALQTFADMIKAEMANCPVPRIVASHRDALDAVEAVLAPMAVAAE